MADRRLRDWLKVYCDVFDFGTSQGGGVSRPTLCEFERHLNARGWRDRLAPLRLYQVTQHRDGLRTLHVAPKRRAEGRSPTIVIQYKITIGADRKRAEGQLHYLNHQLHDGLLYHEREDDAIYAYATYTVPKYSNRVRGKTVYVSNACVNAKVQNAEDWLRQVFLQGGAHQSVRNALRNVPAHGWCTTFVRSARPDVSGAAMR
jgi:hypothetical protein